MATQGTMNPGQLTQAIGQLQAFATGMQRSTTALYMQLVRLKQRVYAIEATERLRQAGRTATMPVEFTSQFGEDCLLWDAFGGAIDGYFVEVGAFDGYAYSVTHGLEAVGWRGLLVEAIPERAAQCAARRKGSVCVHSALGAPNAPAEIEFTVVEDQYGGMLSFAGTDTDHAREMASHGSARRKVRVPVTTLDRLLEGKTQRVDVASIDVEGYELEVLKGFDLERWRPRVLLIEDNAKAPRPDITAYMQGRPYTWVGTLECNRVLVRHGEAEIESRLKRVLSGA